MRFLFASAEVFPPELFGGAECSMDELARELAARGHACVVIAGSRAPRALPRALAFGLLGRRAPRERRHGFPVRRTARPLVPAEVAVEIRAARPDLVVAWNGGCGEIAHVALAAGVPVLVWVADAAFQRYRASLPRAGGVGFAGCSRFVVERLNARLGVDATVLRPVIRFDDYRAPARQPAAITLVSPRHAKGLEVALGVAHHLRHRRVRLVGESYMWPLARLALAARLRDHANVDWARTIARPRDVYAKTSILLVPSQMEDASPRVVLEAQVNGIPVVGSRIGGIPEVMGDGGVLVDHDAPVAVWAEAVEAILSDPQRAGELAARARANAARPELGAPAIVDGFVALARRHAGARA